MNQNKLQVYVRDPALKRIGQIDDYTSLTVVPRHNAVGAFTMEISADSKNADLLTEGNGLIIRTATGDTVMTGPIRTPDWSRSSSDGGAGKLTVGGVDDTALLTQYACWPNPTATMLGQTSPVYKISATVAETAMRTLVNVNAGPGAQASRKNALLTLAADGAHGPVITRDINQFDNLFTVLADIANAASLGIRVVQVGQALQFQVYVPVDRSETARFSFGFGNLLDASYSTTPPTCTKAIVVAGGQGSGRVCKAYTRTDPLFPNLVVEQFVDLTGTDSTATDLAAQQDQAAEEALTNGAGQGSLSISPIDIPKLRYGRDYSVGDTASAQLRGGAWVSQVVREVTLTSTVAEGTTVKATLASAPTEGITVVARIYSHLAAIKKDIRKLKTRKAA